MAERTSQGSFPSFQRLPRRSLVNKKKIENQKSLSQEKTIKRLTIIIKKTSLITVRSLIRDSIATTAHKRSQKIRSLAKTIATKDRNKVNKNNQIIKISQIEKQNL